MAQTSLITPGLPQLWLWTPTTPVHYVGTRAEEDRGRSCTRTTPSTYTRYYDGGTTEFGEDGRFYYVILYSILTEYTRVSIHLHKVQVRVLFLSISNVYIE